MIQHLDEQIIQFNSTTHGASSYDQELVYLRSQTDATYLPLGFLLKNASGIGLSADPAAAITQLQALGYSYSSADFLEDDQFGDWYRQQFGKRLTTKLSRHIGVLSLPRTAQVKSLVDQMGALYLEFRKERIINNGKNLPVQLAEWYAKVIFGLKQIKSTSQRGFDFFNPSQKRVEVMVDWNDRTSPKGAKLKKSLVELSDNCLVMYINHQFLIREMLYLDSSFLLRKFSTKSHTIFLKDSMVADYYFSASAHHHDKIVAKEFFKQFATKQLLQKMNIS